MAKGEQRSSASSKRARVESTLVLVKQEMVEDEGGETMAAAEATVPRAEATVPREELTVRIYRDKLHCPVCTRPFKPPIFQFQCESGHTACGACHAQLPKERCYACGRDGTYRRNTTLEDVLSWPMVLCPYEGYGCLASITYHEAGDHQLECPWAPCRCSEAGCNFVGSPPMLCDHLAAAPHSWPVQTIRYGITIENISLLESLPRRLLVAEEDGRVFLVSSCAIGSSFRGVSVVCIRASAAAGPKYSCAISSFELPERSNASRKVSEMLRVHTWEVPCCSEPGEATAEEMVLLVLQNKILRGASKQISLDVWIDKVPARSRENNRF